MPHGKVYAMKTTIDSAGRLVIPKEIRREAGLRPGMPLDIRWRDGHIEIEPSALPVKLVRRGRMLVAEPEHPVPPLTVDVVERTRTALRRDRSRGG
jgi:AbrB family looped-hinge helix DNA binding protein